MLLYARHGQQSVIVTVVSGPSLVLECHTKQSRSRLDAAMVVLDDTASTFIVGRMGPHVHWQCDSGTARRHVHVSFARGILDGGCIVCTASQSRHGGTTSGNLCVTLGRIVVGSNQLE